MLVGVSVGSELRCFACGDKDTVVILHMGGRWLTCTKCYEDVLKALNILDEMPRRQHVIIGEIT